MSAHTIESSNELIYTDQEIELLDLENVPKHIAIIMDGNRRWARTKGLPPAMGHWEGAEVLTDVLRGAAQLGVKTLTVYAFSTENWARSDEEVEELMNLFKLYLERKKEIMIRDGVRLESIGDVSKLPENVRVALADTKQATKDCDRINLLLALNYGGRDEICRAVQKALDQPNPPQKITEEIISKYLDTALYSDPELMIRTSGEMRISNFLLWQVSYSEFVSTEVLWPDFNAKELLKAILLYQKRSRRLGG